MMHCNNVVVALVDDNKNPVREHDSKNLGSSPSSRARGIVKGRSCQIVLPFETEFKLLIKNLNSCRIKLDIKIDGANVSGSGLIMDGNSTEYIERSVDVAQKFKFVTADHEDVADPTNKENGNIVVTIWKEKPAHYGNVRTLQHEYTKNVTFPEPQPVWYDTTTITCSCDTDTDKKLSSLRSFAANNTMPVGDVGAVVDGGDSEQTFGTTTWNGNESRKTQFVFYLRGASQESVQVQQKELEELERLKKKYNM